MIPAADVQVTSVMRASLSGLVRDTHTLRLHYFLFLKFTGLRKRVANTNLPLPRYYVLRLF